jgi:hypothetical protein
MKPLLPYNEKPKVCLDANLAGNIAAVAIMAAIAALAVLVHTLME